MNANAESASMFIAYNLKRLFGMLKTQELIKKFSNERGLKPCLFDKYWYFFCQYVYTRCIFLILAGFVRQTDAR